MKTTKTPLAVVTFLTVACSRPQPPPTTRDPQPPPATAAGRDAAAAESDRSSERAPPSACGSLPCLRFDTAEDALRHVLRSEPAVLAIGEAHAQKGTEAIASTTKRFTEQLLPIVAPQASDLVVELWAADPRCQKEVKAVATAQRPVVDEQAATNQSEYVTLGTRAKELGVTPWLLRPTCDDFATLADAGPGSLDLMLRLVKRLTQQKIAQTVERNRSAAGGKIAIAYGGALHNDLRPPPATAAYSFGPELDRLTGGRYVELDLIVPEFVRDTDTWKKLPWYAAHKAAPEPRKATIYVVGERSFVLVLPAQ